MDWITESILIVVGRICRWLDRPHVVWKFFLFAFIIIHAWVILPCLLYRAYYELGMQRVWQARGTPLPPAEGLFVRDQQEYNARVAQMQRTIRLEKRQKVNWMREGF